MDSESIKFKSLGDVRGELVAIEGKQSIPFEIRRVYYIFRTGKGVERGHHAHKELHQVAIAVSGSCEIVLDDGFCTTPVTLDSPTVGLYIKPGNWRVMRNFSEDCVLLVLASLHYDEDDYIRDYHAFQKWVKNKEDE